MKITKSGFYKLSDLFLPPLEGKFPTEDIGITIGNNITVALFDDIFTSPLLGGDGEGGSSLEEGLNLTIGENSKVEVYGYLEGGISSEINIIQAKPSSSLKCNYLLVSGEGELIKAKIKSRLAANNTISNVKIISIVLDDGAIDLDGAIDIAKDIEKVSGHLLEENIFIGSRGKIKALPTLLVGSNNVKASHACKIESISDEKLFYLRSRGIGRANALSMMIEAKILDLFACLTMMDKEFYDELIEDILKKIK